MLVYHRVTPQQYVAGTHLYTWVKRDKVEYSSLSKETTRRARLKALNRTLPNTFCFVDLFCRKETNERFAICDKNYGLPPWKTPIFRPLKNRFFFKSKRCCNFWWANPFGKYPFFRPLKNRYFDNLKSLVFNIDLPNTFCGPVSL